MSKQISTGIPYSLLVPGFYGAISANGNLPSVIGLTPPPVSAPPASTPPVTNPPVTTPPVTNPPVTTPPVTIPTVQSDDLLMMFGLLSDA